MEKLQNVDSITEKANQLNRISFATENNIDQIKKVWKCFFDEINRVDIAIECAKLTPHEIIEICKSFRRKFDIIINYATAEVVKREGKRQNELN